MGKSLGQLKIKSIHFRDLLTLPQSLRHKNKAWDGHVRIFLVSYCFQPTPFGLSPKKRSGLDQVRNGSIFSPQGDPFRLPLVSFGFVQTCLILNSNSRVIIFFQFRFQFLFSDSSQHFLSILLFVSISCNEISFKHCLKFIFVDDFR